MADKCYLDVPEKIRNFWCDLLGHKWDWKYHVPEQCVRCGEIFDLKISQGKPISVPK